LQIAHVGGNFAVESNPLVLCLHHESPLNPHLLSRRNRLRDWSPPTRAAEEIPSKPAKPVLEKGMPAETILKLVGKPTEITPLTSSGGKAETWTYRRVVDTQHLLDATTVETIPVFVRASATEGNVMGTATGRFTTPST